MKLVPWLLINVIPTTKHFQQMTKLLKPKVEILNNEFSKLNAGTDGPKFSFELLKYSRVRTGRNKRKLKSKYTFNIKDLYNDGIHPNPLLAHLWLRKIQEIVLDKCF